MKGLYRQKTVGGTIYMRFIYRDVKMHRSTDTEIMSKAIKVMQKIKKDIDRSLDYKDDRPKVLFLKQAIRQTYRDRWSKNADRTGTLARMNVNLKILGDIPVNLIDTKVVLKLRRTLERKKNNVKGRPKHRASSTVNRHMAHLKTVLNDCRKLGYIKRLPLFSMPSERDRRRTRIITVEERRALNEYFNTPTEQAKSTLMRRGLALQIELLFVTGMRLGESLKMEYGRHIQLDRKVIVLSADITKGRATRTIPLNPYALKILQQRYDDGYTVRPFPWEKYFVNKVWSKARKIIGIPKSDKEFVCHAIRHTVATRLLEKGVPVPKVQKLLGHKNLSTTDIYNQLIAEDIRDDLDDL